MVDHRTRVSLLVRLKNVEDDEAWWEFDRCYRELILRYSRHFGLQQADAEDVRQEVMMQLARTMPGFRYDSDRGRFRSYLRQSIKNAATRRIRRPSVGKVELSTSVEPAVGGDADDAAWEREWMGHHYRIAMETIRRQFDPRSVEVFDAILAGREVQEVARQHEMSTQAVHKVKQRVKQRLIELISRQVREEEGEVD